MAHKKDYSKTIDNPCGPGAWHERSTGEQDFGYGFNPVSKTRSRQIAGGGFNPVI